MIKKRDRQSAPFEGRVMMRSLKSAATEMMPPEIFRVLNGMIYFGFKYQCPICGWRFRTMRPAGHPARLNALCPFCGSLERHRLLWLYLRNQTDFFDRPHKVLHFAPEPVFQKIFKDMPNLRYTSADLSSEIAMVRMDITHIPEENGAYDVILCTHVLEHIPDDRKAMNELYRVLKPGGWAILQVPILCGKTFEDEKVVLPEERARIFGQKDHVRKYGIDYKDRLEGVGFKVKVDDYIKNLGENKIREYALMSGEAIYFCKK
ncbi:MAG: methyltransferase domain-containing protein [Candidatus Omnitrophica bacterium]|nr:methyltransferase domain-containing protein [Candidatus Omnitrophota bacterium]